MFRVLGVLALLATVSTACGKAKQTASDETTEDDDSEKDAPKKKKKKAGGSVAVADTAAPAATSGAVASATSSAAAPLSPSEIIAKKFAGDPLEGTPRPIFKSSLPSGLVVIVPPEFEPGAGTYGDGYDTEIWDKTNPNLPVYASYVHSFALPKKEYPFDPDSTVGNAVNIKMKQDKWEDLVPVSIGPDRIAAKVRRGTGVGIHSKKPWGAWCLSAEHEGRVIGVCGGWQADRPELEEKVISILKSVRKGKGAPTDRGQP